MDEGQNRMRMDAVKGANQLTPEHFKAMQPAPLLTAKIQIEGAPIGVRVPAVLSQHVEVRFPVGPAVLCANWLGQRPVEGVALGDPKQADGGIVDEMRQLLDVIVEQAVAGVKLKLALDRRN